MRSFLIVLVIILTFFTSACTKRGPCVQCTDPEELKKKVEAWQLLNTKVFQSYEGRNYKEAIKAAKRSLDYSEREFGLDSNIYATSLNNLGEIYRSCGKHKDAEVNYKKALEIREKVLGKEHNDVALLLNNLATMYYQQKKYNLALPLYIRARQILEAKPQKNDKDLDTILTNIANLYRSLSKYKEAELILKKIITLRESKGKNNASYARSLNELAALYYIEGKYKEAEPLFKEALQILEKVLDKSNPEVRTVLENIVEVYTKLGMAQERDVFAKRVKEIKSQSLLSG